MQWGLCPNGSRAVLRADPPGRNPVSFC
jgi:hypothetical protein